MKQSTITKTEKMIKNIIFVFIISCLTLLVVHNHNEAKRINNIKQSQGYKMYCEKNVNNHTNNYTNNK